MVFRREGKQKEEAEEDKEPTSRGNTPSSLTADWTPDEMANYKTPRPSHAMVTRAVDPRLSSTPPASSPTTSTAATPAATPAAAPAPRTPAGPIGMVAEMQDRFSKSKAAARKEARRKAQVHGRGWVRLGVFPGRCDNTRSYLSLEIFTIACARTRALTGLAATLPPSNDEP